MASKLTFSWELYHKAPIIGIIRNVEKDEVLRIADVYLEAGFHTLEITMNTKGAADIISTLRRKFYNLNVGAGTVCSLVDLNAALDAGSQFIVTPIINEAVIKTSVSRNIPIFPGAFTPSEIYKAWDLGASAVKLFPATQLGVPYIKDVSAPLDKIKLLPTGGVSTDNIHSFFEAGCFGVGMGSSLLDKQIIKTGNNEELKKHFLAIKKKILKFTK